MFGSHARDPDSSNRCPYSIEINGAQFALLGMHTRAFGPCLTTNNRMLISAMASLHLTWGSCLVRRVPTTCCIFR
jgi:hypothetical protein